MSDNLPGKLGNLEEVTSIPVEKRPRKELLQGNREVITDYYINDPIENERKDYAFKVYVRLNARKQIIRNVSFQHSIFDACYINNCTFDSCDFTGCRFIGCNFHQSAFFGCDFRYAVFERCQIDDDILQREAPREENLKMRFARSLRMNFQQVGDAKGVNRAISLELDATASYLKKSWSSSETYYREKYTGWKRLPQFLKWVEFKLLDLIWGNGENTLKLLRTILIIHLFIAIYDTFQFGNPWNLRNYLASLAASPGVFFGIVSPHPYPVWISSAIAAARLIAFGSSQQFS
ncbi:Low-complexity protein [Cupriavidus taiwanensis]|uniref:Low-complexity protein n=1 Tax=Cupriavidus taiwanensis TaxID=164546 RepID=A0A375I8S9_9BURK|nr:pentapeptide repeat-containing protein [Cupriavidus taiwanensis]SPK71027.1 Low-complexity protein [Cupriavidus taiwanensis]